MYKGGAASDQAISSVVSLEGALNKVNIAVVAITLVLHVGVHVPSHQDFMFSRRSGNARLRARAVQERLPLGGVWGRSSPRPERQRSLRGD